MTRAFIPIAMLALAFAPCAGRSAPAQATAYQITPDHAGVTTSGGTLALQLKPLWSVTLPGAVSYPIIADGAVFVTSAVPNAGSGTAQLYAYDAQTGASLWGPIALASSRPWANASYEAGTLFVVDYDGLLGSYSAATGAAGWSVQLPGQYAFSSPPTASHGIVYVGGAGDGGTLYAVDEASGSLLWTQPVENGDASSPAVGPNGVYVSYACPQVYAFEPVTGAPLWHYSGPCEGGGGRTAVLANGKLYVRDWASSPPDILDAATGTVVGNFMAGPAPAIGASSGFYLANGTLSAVDLATNAQKWLFTGDGSLTSAPIVVDQSVIVGSGAGNLYALDADTGRLTWQVRAPAPLAGPDEQNVSQPLTGLAVANGILVVPAGHTLTAYSLFGPAAPSHAAATSGIGYVQLSWGAAEGAASYNLYLGSSAGSEAFTPVQTGVTGTTVRITQGLSPGADAFFTVKAVGPAGISAASNEVSGRMQGVSAPAHLQARAGAASALLAWSAAAGATAYSVYQGSSAGAESTTPVLSGLTAPRATVSGLKPGGKYYFTVKATAYATLSAPSNEASVIAQSAPPSNLAATAGPTSVTLSWSAVSGADGYDVYLGLSGGGEIATPILSNIAGTSATVTGLAPGGTYYFVARSVTAGVTSAPSNEVSATLPASSQGGGGGLDATSLLMLALLLVLNLQHRAPSARRTAPGGHGGAPC